MLASSRGEPAGQGRPLVDGRGRPVHATRQLMRPILQKRTPEVDAVNEKVNVRVRRYMAKVIVEDLQVVSEVHERLGTEDDSSRRVDVAEEQARLWKRVERQRPRRTRVAIAAASSTAIRSVPGQRRG